MFRPVSRQNAIVDSLKIYGNKLFLIVILLTALGLRLYKLEKESLWIDEIGQVLIAKNSWWLTIRLSARHVGNAPLDYLITHFTLYVGQSESILRLPAVIWGVLSVVVIYWLGRDMFDERTGYLAAFLLTIMPLHIYYSREARFYSLATFLVLLSIYTFKRAVDRNSRWSWMWYGIVHLLALYSHYYVLIVTLIQGAWLFWAVYTKRYARSALVTFVLVIGFVASLFLPWLYYDVYIQGGGSPNANPFGFRFPTLLQFLAGPFIYYRLAAFPSALSVRPLAWWLGFMWVMYLIGIAVQFAMPQKARTSLLLSTLVPFVGLPAILILDYLSHYFFAIRQNIIYTPFLILVVSAVYLYVTRILLRTFQLTNFAKRIAIDLAITTLMMFSVWALWTPLTDIYQKQHKQDFRGVARYLLRHMQPDDILATGYPESVAFYAPELRDRMYRLTPDEISSSLSRLSSLYSNVWIIPEPYRVRMSLQPWIEGHNPIEVFPNYGLGLYLFSKEMEPEDSLVHTSQDAPMESKKDLLDNSAVEDTFNRVMRFLRSEELTPEEKVRIAIEAGRELSDAGRHDKAVDILVQAISLAPDNPKAWTHLGLVYSRQGRRANAILAFQKALESDPNGYWANHLLAEILRRKGQWQDVIHFEQRAVQSAPDDDLRVVSLAQIARAYSQMGNDIKACDVFLQAFAVRTSQEILDEMTGLGCNEQR